jgi:hypothetical protein
MAAAPEVLEVLAMEEDGGVMGFQEKLCMKRLKNEEKNAPLKR